MADVGNSGRSTASDVSFAFLLFLGRQPSSAIITQRTNHPHLDMIRNILRSQEFQDKVFPAIVGNFPLPHYGRVRQPPRALLAWMRRILPLSEQGTALLVDATDWRQVLVTILRDAKIHSDLLTVEGDAALAALLQRLTEVPEISFLTAVGTAAQRKKLAGSGANVAVVSVDAFPRMGGISTIAHHLANALTDEFDSVVFVGPAGSYVPVEYQRRYFLCEDWKSNEKVRNGEAVPVEDDRIYNLIQKVVERYAIKRVVLMHPFYYGLPTIYACKDLGIPCSVFFHGFEIRSQLTNGYPAAQRDIIAQRTLTTLRERTFAVVGLADEILVNSSYTASIFEGFEIHPPVHVVGCGIELETAPMSFFNGEVYDAEQREQRRRVLNLPGERTLGYVGRLIAAKRIDRMLQFCAADERLGAVIVGTGNELAALQAQSKALGLEQRVVFAGKVSEAQKWQILSAIDALCLLSEPDDRTGQVEGFGISALEGVAAGALPVSSGTGGMGDFVIDDETGLVLPPGDDEGAGRKLREMLWSGERVNALVEAARQTIRDRFNYAEIARKLAERWDGAALADDSSAGIFVEATIAETVTVDGEQAAQ